MVDRKSEWNNDSFRTLCNSSMGNKTRENCSIVTSNKNHVRLKLSTSNNDYKNSSLTIYYQNIKGINNKNDELINQLGSKIPHLICLTEQHLSNTGMSCVNMDSSKLGAYFWRKSDKMEV